MIGRKCTWPAGAPIRAGGTVRAPLGALEGGFAREIEKKKCPRRTPRMVSIDPEPRKSANGPPSGIQGPCSPDPGVGGHRRFSNNLTFPSSRGPYSALERSRRREDRPRRPGACPSPTTQPEVRRAKWPRFFASVHGTERSEYRGEQSRSELRGAGTPPETNPTTPNVVSTLRGAGTPPETNPTTPNVVSTLRGAGCAAHGDTAVRRTALRSVSGLREPQTLLRAAGI